MKKAILIAALAAILAGCQTPKKMRDIELKGMYVNGYSETLAIGAGRLTSIPGDKEALAAHYEEDTAWLHPSIKTHKIDIFLVGTNSVASASEIIASICRTYGEVAPQVAASDAEVAKTGGATPLDVVKAGGEVRKAVQLAKTAAGSVGVQSGGANSPTPPLTQSPTSTADCIDGACADGSACADCIKE